MAGAREIYQDHLDRVSRALWTLDLDTIRTYLAIPNRIVTLDTEFTVTTSSELRASVEDFRAYLTSKGAQDFYRICETAEFDDKNPGRITGAHDSYILRDGEVVIEPYRSEMTLMERDGIWRGIEIRSLVNNSEIQLISPDILRAAAATERRPARPGDTGEAQEIYQRVIDICSDALMAGDFESFLPHFTLPHTMQTLSGTLTMANAEELKLSFESFSTSLKSQGATNYIRLADWAEFDGPDRITGRHTSHILRNANYLVQPHKTRLVLERAGDIWRVAGSVAAVAEVTWPVLSPRTLADRPDAGRVYSEVPDGEDRP